MGLYFMTIPALILRIQYATVAGVHNVNQAHNVVSLCVYGLFQLYSTASLAVGTLLFNQLNQLEGASFSNSLLPLPCS